MSAPATGGWPFGKDEGGRDVAAKAADQKAEIAAAKKEVAAAAEPKAANPWWWPFGASSASKASDKPALVQQKVTKGGWMPMRNCAEAIAGSEFTLERRDNALIVIAPRRLLVQSQAPYHADADHPQPAGQGRQDGPGRSAERYSGTRPYRQHRQQGGQRQAELRACPVGGGDLPPQRPERRPIAPEGVGSDMPRADNASAAACPEPSRRSALYPARQPAVPGPGATEPNRAGRVWRHCPDQARGGVCG